MAQKNKEWAKEDVIKLISMYKEHSILWNTQCIDYRNREKKQKILQKFATKFSCTSDEIQRKLHNLRNQVSQEIKKIKKKKTGTSADEVYVSKWSYFSVLQFLLPVLTVNQTQLSLNRTQFPKSRESIDVVTSQLQEPYTVSTDEGKNQNEPQRKKTNSVNKRKLNDNDSTTNDKLFRCALEKLQKESDDDERFGQYVAMELRGIRSDFCKRRLKSEIRKAIVQIIDKDDNMHAASLSQIF